VGKHAHEALLRFAPLRTGAQSRTQQAFVAAAHYRSAAASFAARGSTYGTSHNIGPEELAKVCKGAPEVLVIGTGQQGAAGLTEEGAKFLRERGIRVKAVPSQSAIEEFNKAEGRKAALIHVTC